MYQLVFLVFNESYMQEEKWSHFYNRKKLEINWGGFENIEDAFFHAIGALVQNWNNFELLLFDMLRFSKIPNNVAHYLVYNTGFKHKVEIIKQLEVDGFLSNNSIVIEKMKLFYRYIGVCHENRNFFAHCYKLGGIDNDNINLIKNHHKEVGKVEKITIDIKGLRGIVQDMVNINSFGRNLIIFTSFLKDGIRYDSKSNTIIPSAILGNPPKPKGYRDFTAKN